MRKQLRSQQDKFSNFLRKNEFFQFQRNEFSSFESCPNRESAKVLKLPRGKETAAETAGLRQGRHAGSKITEMTYTTTAIPLLCCRGGRASGAAGNSWGMAKYVLASL